MEVHPLKVLFCCHCRDLFVHKEALVQHKELCTPECMSIVKTQQACNNNAMSCIP